MSPSVGTALVTGASRGLGRALSLALCADGMRVIAMARDGAALNRLATGDVVGGSGCIEPQVADVTCESSVAEALAGLEHLDVVINNAGVAAMSSLADTTVEGFEQMLRVNLVGPFVVMKQTIDLLSPDGIIVNIASDAALKGIAGMSSYVASKHGLLGLARSADLELRSRGIRVVTFCPGPMETEIFGPGTANPSAMPPAAVADIIVTSIRHRTVLSMDGTVLTPRNFRS